MGYWASKVLPKIKKVFEKNGKKTAAVEACKSFDDSKGQIETEFEEKKTELQPKVVEIYEASSSEIKALVNEPKEAGIKNNSTAVNKFLEELVKIEFPGSKPVLEASAKYGLALVLGPASYVFEKVSTFIITEEKDVEAPPAEEKEIVVEEEKKEEAAVETSEPAKEVAEPPKP